MIGPRTNQINIHRLGITLQQVRYRRQLAYPSYTREIPPKSHPKKDHSSSFQRAIKKWLGPKSITGEYYRNKYYYPPQNHRPNYIVPDGKSVVDGKNSFGSVAFGAEAPRRDATLHPFPQNIYCKTAHIIPHDLKAKICEDVNENGLHVQEAAHKYGVKIERIEAILKLQKIEQDWNTNSEVSLTVKQDLAKFADVMYKMFPLYQPPLGADNLTEIPTPHKTLTQRFLTIAESEPFGPIDAAHLLELPVASDTLSKLTEVQEAGDEAKVKLNKVIVGKQREGERTAFKFTSSKAGVVGHRYGASRRDTKKDRAVAFDAEGRMIYI
ncbi:eukaryotic mitochondrial regulator protein-domain-containing protein [Scheffersomyces xylosifermentans]|uniref:eukaryotic mitochondrial regulator protein-domain-containing protein n=1 Tax=Scheffersomyces xylosifermentans TaxID=1304137 RepID=UPI00315D2CAC